MQISRSKLLETPVLLGENVAVLNGTVAGNVAVWADRYGLYPRGADIAITNNHGTESLTIGSEAEGPAVLLCAAGNTVGYLFGGLEVVVPPGETIHSEVPPDAAAKGQSWRVKAALASSGAGPIDVTVTARPMEIVVGG